MLTAIIAAIVAVAVFLVLRKRTKKTDAPLSSSSAAVDRWMKDALPQALAERMAKQGIDRAHLASTLGGDPDASVVSAIEQAVRAIEIEYMRDPQATDLDVRARVRFDDGTEEDLRTRITYTEAPASVRSDFERKATTRAFRKWDFPWMTAR
jgi:hypothetical protein